MFDSSLRAYILLRIIWKLSYQLNINHTTINWHVKSVFLFFKIEAMTLKEWLHLFQRTYLSTKKCRDYQKKAIFVFLESTDCQGRWSALTWHARFPLLILKLGFSIICPENINHVLLPTCVGKQEKGKIIPTLHYKYLYETLLPEKSKEVSECWLVHLFAWNPLETDRQTPDKTVLLVMKKCRSLVATNW